MHNLIFILLVAASFNGGPSWAYEEMTVADGGTVRGTVRLEGQVPKPKGYNLTTLPDQVYCGRISDGQGWRLLQPFNVGAAGAFRDVVIECVRRATGLSPIGSSSLAHRHARRQRETDHRLRAPR